MSSSWKPGDIIMGFGNPVTCQVPLGQVRLHRFVQQTENLELWMVEYMDQPELFYELWVKKKWLRKKEYDSTKKNENTGNEEESNISTETKI